MSYTETKQVFASLHKRCEAQGIAKGHPEFDACMQQEINREVATRNANALKRQQFGDAMADVGADMQANAAARANNRPVQCTSTPGMNGVVRTSCY
ncbi:hypothetical protein ACHMW7_09185 [Aminobacter sp. UC22_36]|uniref:hypothetical protein n=1 Tax=Aminobacter sp. UC22_36 TaxID=3374549 RepID=UPI00375844EB